MISLYSDWYDVGLQIANSFLYNGLPRWLSGKESPCQAGDQGSISGLGRSPREGKIQYSCLGNPRQRSLESYRPWVVSWAWLSDYTTTTTSFTTDPGWEGVFGWWAGCWSSCRPSHQLWSGSTTPEGSVPEQRQVGVTDGNSVRNKAWGFTVSETKSIRQEHCCCLVAKPCPALCDPMDCSPPGPSVHGIF